MVGRRGDHARGRGDHISAHTGPYSRQPIARSGQPPRGEFMRPRRARRAVARRALAACLTTGGLNHGGCRHLAWRRTDTRCRRRARSGCSRCGRDCAGQTAISARAFAITIFVPTAGRLGRSGSPARPGSSTARLAERASARPASRSALMAPASNHRPPPRACPRHCRRCLPEQWFRRGKARLEATPAVTSVHSLQRRHTDDSSDEG